MLQRWGILLPERIAMKCAACAGWLAGVCGLALACRGVENTLVEWQVSLDNVHWASGVQARPGDLVRARAVVFYTGSATPVGLSALAFQATVSEWDSTGPSVDTAWVFTSGSTEIPPYTCEVQDQTEPLRFGRVRPFNRCPLNGGSLVEGYVHVGGSGGAPEGSWLRIAHVQTTAWMGAAGNTSGNGGIPIGQLSNVGRVGSDPPFEGRVTDLVVYKFGVVLSADNAGRMMVVDSPAAGLGAYNAGTGVREVSWFGGMEETTGSIRGSATSIPATIQVMACGSADFNGDGDSATDGDIEAFFACVAGRCCASCGSADFDGDGDSATDADIEAFFRVLAGGAC
jgi:hypothetical protein